MLCLIVPLFYRSKEDLCRHRPKAKMARERGSEERGLSGLSWPPSPSSSECPWPASSASAAVRLSAPCQTRHWMMMTTMITIACSPAHRGATMRGGRSPSPPPRKKAPPPPTASGAAPRRSPHRLPAPVRLSSAAMAAVGGGNLFAPPLSFFLHSRQSLEPFPGRATSPRKTIDNLHMIKPRYCKKEERREREPAAGPTWRPTQVPSSEERQRARERGSVDLESASPLSRSPGGSDSLGKFISV